MSTKVKRGKKQAAVTEQADFADLLGMEAPKVAVEETYKMPHISPFDFVNAIHHTKEDLIVDDWSEKQYNPYVINRALSFGVDTVIFANEMNSRPHISKKAQFMFLSGMIRAKKRFNKWIKPEAIANIDIVKQYYGYSTQKAQDALRILTPEQLDYIRERLNTGG